MKYFFHIAMSFALLGQKKHSLFKSSFMNGAEQLVVRAEIQEIKAKTAALLTENEKLKQLLKEYS